jgi:hypothetical protein
VTPFQVVWIRLRRLVCTVHTGIFSLATSTKGSTPPGAPARDPSTTWVAGGYSAPARDPSTTWVAGGYSEPAVQENGYVKSCEGSHVRGKPFRPHCEGLAASRGLRHPPLGRGYLVEGRLKLDCLDAEESREFGLVLEDLRDELLGVSRREEELDYVLVPRVDYPVEAARGTVAPTARLALGVTGLERPRLSSPASRHSGAGDGKQRQRLLPI